MKQTVLNLLDSQSEDVRGALGACNLVVFRDGRSMGHNTDWMGFAENFRRGLPGAPLDTILQLGAGGAGSAVTYALLKLGARRIAIHEVDRARAQAFVERFNRLAGEERVFIARDLDGEVARASGVVNCTPVGMAKHPGTALPGPAAAARAFGLPTSSMSRCARNCCNSRERRVAAPLGGGGMAVIQAAEAFRLLTGKTPDVERMLARFQHDVEAEQLGG